MRAVVSTLLVFGLLANTAVFAQSAKAPQSNVRAVPDGGTNEVLESIFIPPMAHAPFSLTLATEWTRVMAGGGSYTLANKRRIMRDAAGRIYQERWILVPKGGKFESWNNLIQIADPVTHILYDCFTAPKRCEVVSYSGSTSTKYGPPIGASGPLTNGEGFRTHEEIGKDEYFGVETNGYRDTTTLNPGTFGNDQPMVTKREFWYAPSLGISLRSLLDSPQTGKEVFTVTELSTAEPEASYFAVPEGYTIVDLREVEKK